jgi:hypothetical protein
MPEEMPLRIRLLGRPEVGLEKRILRFERKKALALLCYLAAEGGKRQYPRVSSHPAVRELLRSE